MTIQRQSPPRVDTFHLGNGTDGKHYWLTPPELYAIEDGKPGKGTGRHIACFILQPKTDA